MSNLPFLPLFIDALDADTKHLSDAEYGRYLRLLTLMWRQPECRIPNDDTWISRMMGRPVSKVRNQIRPILDEFCTQNENEITQKRLQKEWKIANDKRTQTRDAANSLWKKKRGKKSADNLKTGDANASKTHDAKDGAPHQVENGEIPMRTHTERIVPADASIPIATKKEAASSSALRSARETRERPGGLLLLCQILGLEPSDTEHRHLDELLADGFDLHQHLEPAARQAAERGAPAKTLNYLRPRAAELRALGNANGSAEHATPVAPSGIEPTDPAGWANRMLSAITVAEREHAKPSEVWNETRMGPPPGKPGCAVPESVLARLMPKWREVENPAT